MKRSKAIRVGYTFIVLFRHLINLFSQLCLYLNNMLWALYITKSFKLMALLIMLDAVFFPLSQLVPVLFIGLVLALHIFVRPYEKLRHNIIEAVILINYILLFLLRGTQTFLDNLSTYTGNQVRNS